jgi:hypothetical protein
VKRFVLNTAALALIVGPSTAHAQFFGSGIVFDPTQSAHAVEQISQGEQIFTNTVKIANNAIAAYNLAYQMSRAPQTLYQPYTSPSTYWMALNHAANTYGNSQLVVSTANTGANAAGAYQFASVPRTGIVPQYSTLSVSGQQQIAAQGATIDLNDSIAESNLQALGTMRANEMQREQDLEKLESASHSLDPTQQTDMATMQRINQALILQLREQQEANQLLQAVALQQMVTQKQQQDAIKAAAQDAADYGSNFQTQIAPANNGTAQALTY